MIFCYIIYIIFYMIYDMSVTIFVFLSFSPFFYNFLFK